MESVQDASHILSIALGSHPRPTHHSITGYPQGVKSPEHDDKDGKHSSNTITSLSTGRKATFRVWSDVPGATGRQQYSIELSHGDVLVFDRRLRHSVSAPKYTSAPNRGRPRTFPRVNITFRVWDTETLSTAPGKNQ